MKFVILITLVEREFAYEVHQEGKYNHLWLMTCKKHQNKFFFAGGNR